MSRRPLCQHTARSQSSPRSNRSSAAELRRRTDTGCSGSRCPARPGRRSSASRAHHAARTAARRPFDERRADHRGVDVDVRISLGQARGARRTPAAPQWAITAVSRGCARAAPCSNGPGPVCRAGDRAAAAVHDDRHAGLGEQAPHVVEQRVARVEAADLHVHLEDPGTGVERRRARSRRRTARGRTCRVGTQPGVRRGELPRPDVRSDSRHVRLVRVDQRGNDAHARARAASPARSTSLVR